MTIPYSSATLAMLVFKSEGLGRALDGFGFLVPRQEQQTMAAATWVNTKWPSRVPDGLAALRAFIVGDKAEALATASRNEILTLVRKDFNRLMGVRTEPLFDTVYSWPKSMPQYVVGHEARISRLMDSLKPHNGLYLTGNYIDGVGVPDAVRNAKAVAKQIGDSGV